VFYSTGQWNFEVDTETIFEENSFLKKKILMNKMKEAAFIGCHVIISNKKIPNEKIPNEKKILMRFFRKNVIT
jgi:hypothetical protein